MVQVNNDTPQSNITIQGLLFSAPAPYAAGHTITEGEAHALNQVLAENLRNNFASTVKKAVEASKEEGGAPVDKAELDAAFAEYVGKYEFGVRQAGTSSVAVDPVEREALKLAKAVVRNAIKAAGRKVSDYAAEDITTLAGKILEKKPEIYDTARENIARSQAAAKSDVSLDDLLAA